MRDRARAAHLERAGCELRRGRRTDAESLAGIGEGIDVAYFLIHAMAGGAGFAGARARGASELRADGQARGRRARRLPRRPRRAERLQAPRQPPRDRSRARRRGAAADLLPGAMVVGRGERVLQHAPLPRQTAARDDRAELAEDRDAADRRRRRHRVPPPRPRGRPPRAGARSRSAAPTCSPTAQMLDRMAIAMGLRPRPQMPVPFITPVALGAVARPRDARRHERRAPAGRGSDDRDDRHRPVWRRAVRHHADGLRRRAAQALADDARSEQRGTAPLSRSAR